MIIPVGYYHIQHFFGGTSLPNGAAITYGLGGFGAGTPAEAAEACHDAFASTFLLDMSSTTQIVETRAKAGPNDVGPFGSYTEILVGGQTDSPVPPNTALLVEKRTAVGGRSGRGRFYLPGVPEGSVPGSGILTVTIQGFWQARADAFLTALETFSTGMYVLHNTSSDPTSVTDLQVDPVVATQRRRLR